MESLVPIIEKVVNFGIGAVIVFGAIFIVFFLTMFVLMIRNFKRMEEGRKRRGL